MDILVVHPSLNEMGGSERVALTIIESLKEKGHHVMLGTFEKTVWEKVTEFFGEVCKPDTEFTFPRIFGKSAYGELLNFYTLFSKLVKKSGTVIISTSSPWFYCPVVQNLIIYFNCSPVNYIHGFKHAYLLPYNILQWKLLRKIKCAYFLTNSSFSSEAINEVYHLKAEVVYPPVCTEVFHPSSKKDDLVISIGRIDPSKNFDTLIRAFSRTEKGKCIIIGSSKSKESSYLEYLKRLINQLKLNDRVDLVVNCSLKVLQSILSKAKIYVHCARYEYFGMSVVEAMACGCVPIVHQSGGPYTDIIEKGKYGFSFKTASELTSKIDLLLKNDGLWKEVSNKAIVRSKIFNKKRFKDEITRIVESFS
jgi:glycosyltransferase involved in cell wall biosynthesis